MPSTISKAIECGIPLRQLEREVTTPRVLELIEMIVFHLTSLINVDPRLSIQKHQLTFIAEELLRLYGARLTAEDFSVCFKRGSMGQYGEIYRLDGAVIGTWLETYIVEKDEEAMRQLYAEKENHYKLLSEMRPPANQISHSDHLQRWLQSLPEPKRIGMTEVQAQKEGQVRPPKPPAYPSSSVSELRRHEYHAMWIRYNFDPRTGEKFPEWMAEAEWIEANKSELETWFNAKHKLK